MRHIVLMTLSSTVGLLSLFFVDLVDMYFLSLLGQKELAAAVGFSGTLLFFMTALCIAASIALGAKVSQALGQKQLQRARELCVHSLVFSFLLTGSVTIPVWLYCDSLLGFLGAKDETLDLAMEYTLILLPSTPLLGLGMSMAAGLRAAGDAKRSMYAITGGGIVNAILDPILIFGLDLEIAGAAWASVAARVTIFSVAGYFLVRKHGLLTSPKLQGWLSDFPVIFSVAGPAMMTNLATPIGGSYVTKSMAEFGDGAVAGAAIIGRLVPVGFCGLFALSGAIGPIFGQNIGAELYPRVRQVLTDAVKFAAAYVLFVWAVFFVAQDFVVAAFEASDEAADLIKAYCTWIVPGFFFNGLLFTANAAFNNMNAAYLATLFNFSRTLLGTIPFVYVLAMIYGPVGVLMGEIAGAIVFGSLAIITAFWKIPKQPLAVAEPEDCQRDSCQWTYCSEKSALGQQIVEPDENLLSTKKS